MSKYQTLNHEKFLLRYHVIFSTKYRRKLLDLIDIDLKESFKRAEAMQNKWFIELMETDKDHIHFLIKSCPSISISDIVHKLKQISTYDMWKKNYNIMKGFYWKQHYLWTRGYLATTIGDISENVIKNYIKNQKY